MSVQDRKSGARPSRRLHKQSPKTASQYLLQKKTEGGRGVDVLDE